MFLRISKNNMVTVLKRNVLAPIINTSRWGIIGSNNYLIIRLKVNESYKVCQEISSPAEN